jgi:hypothetical protein
VIDSGLEMSAEFQGRVTAFYDMTVAARWRPRPSTTTDTARTSPARSAIGRAVALERLPWPGAERPADRAKAARQDRRGYTSDVIRAIDFAVRTRARLGIAMINLFVGHPIAQPAGADPLVQAVERAVPGGLIVVVAAGNQASIRRPASPVYAGITSPGNAPSAITVGAARTDTTVIRSDDRIPDYSSAVRRGMTRWSSPIVVARATTSSPSPPSKARSTRRTRSCWRGPGLHPS